VCSTRFLGEDVVIVAPIQLGARKQNYPEMWNSAFVAAKIALGGHF